MASNVRVAVRVRPLSRKETDVQARNIISTGGNCINITNVKAEGQPEFGDHRERVKSFTFDYCYDNASDCIETTELASQELVYQDLGTEVLQAAFEGYNACMFAYGQTGTGKTYTMMGYPGEIGLIPRICEALFSHSDDCPEENVTFRIELSFMEIYNERVRDLLRRPKKHEKYTLKVREHPKEGPYVQDLSRHKVKDYKEIQMLLDRGNENRTTASTHMHRHSSRSHAIVTIIFTQAKFEDGLPSEIVSKVHLVDLAGSERADPNYHADYKGRIKEGANINKSLVTLGNVIKALAEKSLLYLSTETMGSTTSLQSSTDRLDVRLPSPSRRAKSLHIPYRDSVLTWLLKDSLGGNSKTLMIATVSPASVYYSETISTLRYAQRAKSIVNKPKVNEDDNVRLIRELRGEIERLKQMLATARMSGQMSSDTLYLIPYGTLSRVESFHGSGPILQMGSTNSLQGFEEAPIPDPGSMISERLKENEAMANQLTQTWMEKWNDTQSIMEDSDLSIRGVGSRKNSSYGVIIDSQVPHLIGIDDDVLTTGITIYHIKEGTTHLGQEDPHQDIVLKGPDVIPSHCHIENMGGVVTLFPEEGAMCLVNGEDITKPRVLQQGDTVLLGKTNMFRFNNPAQAARLREHRHNSGSHSMGLPGSVDFLPGDSSTHSSYLDLSVASVGRPRQPQLAYNPK